MGPASLDTGEGLSFETIFVETFRQFARQHGTSTEIGPIGTYLDSDHGRQAYGDPFLFGLLGCGELCAAVSCTVSMDPNDRTHACKLDSIIVHPQIRRGGLGGVLVANAFLELIADKRLQIGRLYSYAVHPATERLLARLSFSNPPPTGAPLSALEISDDNRDQVATTMKVRVQDMTQRLGLQCAYCSNHDKRARPWCLYAKS